MPIGKKLSNETRKRILALAEKGLRNPEISRALGISENSVKRYRKKGDIVKNVKSKKSVKIKKEAGIRGGAGDPINNKTENEGSGYPAENGEYDTIKGESIEFIGGNNEMKKEDENKANIEVNTCGSCGSEVKGEPDKCPSCGAEFDYS